MNYDKMYAESEKAIELVIKDLEGVYMEEPQEGNLKPMKKKLEFVKANKDFLRSIYNMGFLQGRDYAREECSQRVVEIFWGKKELK